MLCRHGRRAQRVHHVGADPAVRVALAQASVQGLLHQLDRAREVAPGGGEEPESADRVRLPARVIHRAPQREGMLERLRGQVGTALANPHLRQECLWE